MADDPQKTLAIERAIRRYCAEHARACDTVEGVRRWWLDGLRCSPEEVERVLALLARRGELSVRTLSDGRRLYACSSRHLQRVSSGGRPLAPSPSALDRHSPRTPLDTRKPPLPRTTRS